MGGQKVFGQKFFSEKFCCLSNSRRQIWSKQKTFHRKGISNISIFPIARYFQYPNIFQEEAGFVRSIRVRRCANPDGASTEACHRIKWVWFQSFFICFITIPKLIYSSLLKCSSTEHNWVLLHCHQVEPFTLALKRIKVRSYHITC